MSRVSWRKRRRESNPEALGCRGLRTAKDIAGQTLLHHLTVLHDSNEVANLRGHPQIELLRQLRGTGATVLIAEQNMHFCLGLASHATVIDKGRIVYTATIEDMKANDNICQRYLAV